MPSGERNMTARWFRLGIAAFLVLFFITACGASPVEQALVGTWESTTSNATFMFAQDKTYMFHQPGEEKITGKYYALGSPISLADAQFDLETIGIRFMPTGDAFYIYVDGAGGTELFCQMTPGINKKTSICS
jgi:hypothetical protein